MIKRFFHIKASTTIVTLNAYFGSYLNQFVAPLFVLVVFCNNKDLKKVQKIAKIETKMTFHLSRHSFADIHRTRGTSINDISNLLGHSDIKITQRYLKGFDAITFWDGVQLRKV